MSPGAKASTPASGLADDDDKAAAKMTRNQKAAAAAVKSASSSASASSAASLDIGACSCCHVALDYSDRAAFFPADRHEDYTDDGKKHHGHDEDDTALTDANENQQEEETDHPMADANKPAHSASSSATNDDDDDDSYYFRKSDPYLPESLYDPNNALVYCDSCDRLYHQKCHFVPLATLPRPGVSWHCLVCQTLRHQQQSQKSQSKRNNRQPNNKRAVELLQTRLFVSPPDSAVRELEVQWEESSRLNKAALWHHELRRLKQACKGQLALLRQAATALDALTSTRRNRQYFIDNFWNRKGSSNSQELAQTLSRLLGAKYKLRQLCLQLEDVRRQNFVTDQLRWQTLKQFCDRSDVSADFVERVVFPFGCDHPRRIEPRTPELDFMMVSQQQQEYESTGGPSASSKVRADGGVPSEIVLQAAAATTNKGCHHHRHSDYDNNNDQLGKRGRKKGAAAAAAGTTAQKMAPAHHKKGGGENVGSSKDDDDDDDGISLDNLKCCVCLKGTATDNNDLILCDGSGCYRAYHMKCCKPAVTLADVENEDDDWFCPLCQGIADLLHFIQSEYMGDDWDQRRMALQWEGKPTDASSVQSWANVDQVFPDAEREYMTACELKEGKRTAATNELIARVLGLDLEHGGGDADEDDEDDIDEDGHFDLEAFHEERRKAAAKDETKDDDEESSHSSQATLEEMSSVELEIGEAELAALSSSDRGEDDDDESESDSQDSQAPARRSLRLRKREATNSSSDNSDPGKLDEKNIVKGRRNRKPVDYRKLNDVMFGDLEEGEAAKIDDEDEFKAKARKKESSESSDDEDSDSDDGESMEGETGTTDSGQEGGRKRSRQQSNSSKESAARKKRKSRRASDSSSGGSSDCAVRKAAQRQSPSNGQSGSMKNGNKVGHRERASSAQLNKNGSRQANVRSRSRVVRSRKPL